MRKSYSKIRHMQQSNLLIERRHLNEEEEVANIESIASEDGITTSNIQTYFCNQTGIPPFVQKLIDKLPEDKREEAKTFISKFIETIKSPDFKIKDLLSIRKQIKDEKQKSQTQVNEQLTPIIIAGISISPSLLIAVGAIILMIIAWKIYTKLNPKCGFGKP